jgi:GDP-L-fucose synthase
LDRTSRIYVAGGDTLLGAALRKQLYGGGYKSLFAEPPHEPDLTSAAEVDDFFREVRPEYVFLVAGKSGGIQLNQHRPAELMLENLLTAAHVLSSAQRHGTIKLLYLASACSYPKDAPQPLRTESLMTGPLEPTSAAYATAKLAGWQLCKAYRRQSSARFITAFPTNSFGPHDDFGPDSGHVIPNLIRRMHEAKARDDSEVSIWGTGKPRREFLFAQDLADACLHIMLHYDAEAAINLGGGVELSIAKLAQTIAEVVGYRGRIRFDTSRPDGARLKALDGSVLKALGWGPVTDFRQGLAETYSWFLQHVADQPQTKGRALPAMGVGVATAGAPCEGLPHDDRAAL